MNNILEVVKKTGLFLFGIVLILWGYRANAATGKQEAVSAKGGISSLAKALQEKLMQQQDTTKQIENKQNKEEPAKDIKTTLPTQKGTEKKTDKKKEEKKVEPQTVIEKETPEESSGTE